MHALGRLFWSHCDNQMTVIIPCSKLKRSFFFFLNEHKSLVWKDSSAILNSFKLPCLSLESNLVCFIAHYFTVLIQTWTGKKYISTDQLLKKAQGRWEMISICHCVILFAYCLCCPHWHCIYNKNVTKKRLSRIIILHYLLHIMLVYCPPDRI